MLQALDSELLHWFHLNRIVFFDGFLRFISSVNTYVSLALIILVVLLSRFRKRGWSRALQLFITFALAALLTLGIKTAVDRERPFSKYETITKLTDGGGSSFPSGHTLEAFAMATALGLIFRRWFVWTPAILWAILIGYSRIALGVHFPGDVLAAMGMGILIAFGVNYFFRTTSSQ